MFNTNFFILFGIFIIVSFLVLSFFFPAEERNRKRQKRKEAAFQVLPQERKWQEVAVSLRERISIFKKEIGRLDQEKKKIENLLNEERHKNIRLEEKLKREKKWFSEQESSLGKRAQDVRQAKIEMVRLQTDLEKEYSLRLAAEREQRVLKDDFDKTIKEKKDLILKVTQLEFTVKTQREELVDLRRSHDVLLRKQEETGQWVAKTEFEKLEKLLREKEREIQKIKKSYRD